MRCCICLPGLLWSFFTCLLLGGSLLLRLLARRGDWRVGIVLSSKDCKEQRRIVWGLDLDLTLNYALMKKLIWWLLLFLLGGLNLCGRLCSDTLRTTEWLIWHCAYEITTQLHIPTELQCHQVEKRRRSCLLGRGKGRRKALLWRFKFICPKPGYQPVLLGYFK